MSIWHDVSLLSVTYVKLLHSRKQDGGKE